jgi:AcrR family transcriptional regulator
MSDSIWLRPERAARGPAPEHSRAEIAAAAVRLADSGGLAAASMRKVAEAVGTGPASLYRYVANRQELLSLMTDQVAAEVRHPEPSGDWVADLTAVARELVASYVRHPWTLDVPVAAGDLGPHVVDHLERSLAILAPVDVPARQKLEAIAMLSGIASLFARQVLSGDDAAAPERQAAAAAHLSRVVAGGRHPHLAAALGAPGEAPGAADGLFERILAGILTGLLAPPAQGVSKVGRHADS